MNRTDEALTAMLAAYSQAVAGKDVEAFLHLYDPAVRVFDAWDAWLYEGRGAWCNCVRAWFAAGSDRVSASFEDVRMSNADDFATLSAILTYAEIAADGTRTREMQNRLTWVLRKGGGVWRIVHEHTSAPIDFGQPEAILRRVQTS